MGEKFVFLGVCIVSVAAGYHIHQQEYVKELLKDWGMESAKGSENLKEEAAQYTPQAATAEELWGNMEKYKKRATKARRTSRRHKQLEEP